MSQRELRAILLTATIVSAVGAWLYTAPENQSHPVELDLRQRVASAVVVWLGSWFVITSSVLAVVMGWSWLMGRVRPQAAHTKDS